MKQKMSLTLSEDLVEEIDRLAGPDVSRSSFVESILREFVTKRARARRDARDVAIINRNAKRLNAEIEDAMSYQVSIDDE